MGIIRYSTPRHAHALVTQARNTSPTHYCHSNAIEAAGKMPKKGKKAGKKGKGKKAEKDEGELKAEKTPFEAPENTSKELELQIESVSSH